MLVLCEERSDPMEAGSNSILLRFLEDEGLRRSGDRLLPVRFSPARSDCSGPMRLMRGGRSLSLIARQWRSPAVVIQSCNRSSI